LEFGFVNLYFFWSVFRHSKQREIKKNVSQPTICLWFLSLIYYHIFTHIKHTHTHKCTINSRSSLKTDKSTLSHSRLCMNSSFCIDNCILIAFTASTNKRISLRFFHWEVHLGFDFSSGNFLSWMWSERVSRHIHSFGSTLIRISTCRFFCIRYVVSVLLLIVILISFVFYQLYVYLITIREWEDKNANEIERKRVRVRHFLCKYV
jgi:hypothetical protein